MPKIIAHRGASSLAPQNTVAAFKKAVDIGADGIETDVHLTKDGKLVICHNYEIDETSDGKGKISDMTFDEIRQYDFSSGFSSEFAGEKIPTLEEFLCCAKDLEKIIIEIKTPERENNIAKKTVETVKEFGLLSKTVFSCFSTQIIRQCKAADKSSRIAQLFDMRTKNVTQILSDPTGFCKENDIDELHPIIFFISEEFVKKCNESSVETYFWTVNDASSKDDLEKIGVTGIITDVPEQFLG